MAQPANTSINVFLNVRAQRKDLRHESVAAIIKKLRPLIMSVPGEEVLVGVLARDTTVKDFSPYMGEARFGANRGFPIVIGALPEKTFAAAQEGITGVDFAFQVGRDKFLCNAAASVTNDIQANLRNDSLVANAS